MRTVLDGMETAGETMDEQAVTKEPLQFTGNWFIDAGILGFVNLMEEVYGWDLEELQRRIQEEAETVYYGYFPFAYFYKLSKEDGISKERVKKRLIEFTERNKSKGKDIIDDIWWQYIPELFKGKWVKKKIEVMHEKICYGRNGKPKPHYTDENYRKLIKKREQLINALVKNEKFESTIKMILGKNKKIIKDNGLHNLSAEDLKLLEEKLNDSSKDMEFNDAVSEIIKTHRDLERYLNEVWNSVKQKNISKENSVFCRIPVDNSFFKNYLFFNNSRGIFEQLEDLRNLLDGNVSYSDYLNKIDKTISKFLPSDNEFPNIFYTKFRTEAFVKEIPHLFVYFLNFLNAFITVANVSIFFYSNDLNLAYQVNKRIKIYLNESRERRNLTLLRVTWQAVIDTIIETESIWSLENMYLIRYERLSQQDLIGVEYIGIPKLQASIVLDDKMRNALNKSIATKVREGRIDKSVWLLEEFIKNRPLLPHIINNIHLCLADDKNKKYFAGKRTLIYASVIDAKIKEFGQVKGLFGDNFFTRYEEMKAKTKGDVKRIFITSNNLYDLFESQDERNNFAQILLEKIKRGDKYSFVNTFLKSLLSKKTENKNIENLVNFAFNKILSNDLTWRNYALSFVISLVGGGDVSE